MLFVNELRILFVVNLVKRFVMMIAGICILFAQPL